MAKTDAPTLSLHFSEQQAHVLSEALEFYSWLCWGRLKLPPIVEMRRLPLNRPNTNYPQERGGEYAVPIDDHDLLQEKLDELRALLFPEFRSPHQWYGVGWNERPEQQHGQIAYELMKAILGERNQRLGIHNVNSLPFLHYSDQPLPVVYRLTPQPTP